MIQLLIQTRRKVISCEFG